MILKALNLRYEIEIPDCFIHFRGSEMKNSITNETSQYSLRICGQSVCDKASEALFKEYGKKVQGEPYKGMRRNYIQMFYDYQRSIQNLDKPLIWGIVDPKEHIEKAKKRRIEKEKKEWISSDSITNANVSLDDFSVLDDNL